MRTAYLLAVAAAVCGGSGGVSVLAAEKGGNFKIEIDGVAASHGGPIDLRAKSSADHDGDGATDAGVLRLVCSRMRLRSASLYFDHKKSDDRGSETDSREAAGPPEVGEWLPLPPELMKMPLFYDLKSQKSLRREAWGGWVPINLSGADGICETGVATKSRGNIANN